MTLLSSLVSPLNAGIYQRFQFSPAQGANTVSGPDINGNVLNYLPNYVQVIKNGLMLPLTDVVASNGTGIAFPGGFNSGDTVDVIALSTMSIASALLYDRSQPLTSPQQAQALANMGRNTEYSIYASMGSNVLTVSLYDKNGVPPTPSSPIDVVYPTSTLTNNGTPVTVSQTSLLSISTVVGATQGTVANVPFRLWLVVFNNSGTNVLSLFQSVTGGSSPTGVARLNDEYTASAVGMSSGATSPGVFYCPSGTTITNMPFKILGYLDFNAGISTPGTYTTGLSHVQIYGPGIKKPGTMTPLGFATSTTQTNAGTTFTAATPSISITPSSTPNLIRINLSGIMRVQTSSISCDLQIFRGSTGIGGILGARNDANSTNTWFPINIFAWDAPGTTSSITYAPYVRSNNASYNAIWLNASGTSDGYGLIEAFEIQA